MKNNMPHHERPTAIYRTTISITLHELIFVAAATFFGYLIFKTDVLWVQILEGILALSLLVIGLNLLKHMKDRIIVAPSHLTLMRTLTNTKSGKQFVPKVVHIQWTDIKDISSDLDIQVTGTVIVTKNVYITLRNGTKYCIDPELYDVFFLERKLKAFWIRYGRKHQPR